MTDRIRNLRIEGFRGATQPFDMEFDQNKPVTLIFGENGTGKSTIVDALEFVGTGQTSFVDAWKVGTRKNSFIPTLGKSLSDVVITMQVNGKSFQATLSASAVNLDNDTDRPTVKVLRRKSLQAFIEAIPSERYREVAAFLDIPQIEASEASLREALKDHNGQFDRAAARTGQAREQLQGLWEAEGSPGADGQANAAERWAREQAQADPDRLKATVDQSQKRIESIHELLRLGRDYEGTKTALADAIEKQKTAHNELQKAETEATQGNSQLAVLLKDAREYLSATPEEVCPVCEETKIDAGALVVRLDHRLSAMTALTKANAAAAQADQQHQSCISQFQQAQKLLTAHEVTTLDLFEKAPEAYAELRPVSDVDEEQAVEPGEAMAGALDIQLPAMEERLEEDRRKMHTLSNIRQAVTTVDRMTAEAKHQEALSKRLEQALNLVESQRKNHVEKVLTEIASAVDSLYQPIYPKEQIGGIQLKLDDKKRGSLLYGVVFGDEPNVHPQPYYSESHLDTLGLCIFLALAKRSGDGFIVVLDDVLGSVDQQHLNRTLDMLLTEADHFGQIILTSHYRPLRNRFTNSRTGSNKVQLVDLKPWSLSDGVRFTTPKLAVYELERKLRQDDIPRDQIAIDGGRLLENAFDYLTLIYGLRMARKPEPKYSLGELFSAVRSIKSWQIRHGNDAKEIKPFLDVLHPLMPVRNEAGAHYNESGEMLSDADIADFGEAALDLLKTLICSDCNGLAQKQDDIGHWKCQCGKTTMKPYKI